MNDGRILAMLGKQEKLEKLFDLYLRYPRWLERYVAVEVLRSDLNLIAEEVLKASA